MSRNMNACEYRPAIFAMSAALLVCLVANAAAGASQADVAITVFADRYVLPGHVFDDLDVLERTVSTLSPGSVRLNACGATAERAQRAAAHRFRTLNVELRWLPSHASECRAVSGSRGVPTNVAHGQRPYGIDDAVVDRWWHEQMP